MNKILDEDFYDLIIDNILLPHYDTDNNTTPLNERFSLLHIPSGPDNACDLGIHPYHRFPSLLTLSALINGEESKTMQINHTSSLSLYGRGVIIGIIDTGIDYTHPAFRHNDGSTRILSLWDQTIQTGIPPEGFTFGSEYSRELINLALMSGETQTIVPSEDNLGHGTAVAGIIGGKPNSAENFSGIVPEADFVIVKLKETKSSLRRIAFVPQDAICYQESDVIFAARYLSSIAYKLSRPLAICVTLGTSQGGRDEHGITTGYLDTLTSRPQMCVSIAAGNEGNNKRHYFGDIVSPFQDATFELQVGSPDRMFAMEIWPYAPSHLSIEVTSPSGETTPIMYPRLNICEQFNFRFDQGTLFTNNINFEEQTGEQLILLRFQNPAPGTWSFNLHNIEEGPFSFHSWLPSGDLISLETYFPDSNPDTTITSPGNATRPLTVTAYNPLDGNIWINSGRGYTRTNQVKPDIAAPGYKLNCPLPGNRYCSATGTGAAVAYATGIVAMLLEWAVVRGNYTSITGTDIRRLLTRGAYRSPELTYPNNIWGYGQIDVDGVFDRLIIF